MILHQSKIRFCPCSSAYAWALEQLEKKGVWSKIMLGAGMAVLLGWLAAALHLKAGMGRFIAAEEAWSISAYGSQLPRRASHNDFEPGFIGNPAYFFLLSEAQPIFIWPNSRVLRFMHDRGSKKNEFSIVLAMGK